MTEPLTRVYVPISDAMYRYRDVTTYPLWTNNQPRLLTPTTSSISHSGSFDYVMEIYNVPETSNECREIQYKIIYADYQGMGSIDLGGKDHETLTKAMYSQYTNILLPPGQTKFNFGSGDEDYVYIIDISRNRFKQGMDPGNWQLSIASCSFSKDIQTHSVFNNMLTASFQDKFITLVDSATKQVTVSGSIQLSNKPFDILLGTIENGVQTLYVSSSIASESLVRGDIKHVITGSNVNSNTAAVLGAEAIPFVFTNLSSSFYLQRNYEDSTGYFNEATTIYYENYGYSGNFTASLSGYYGGYFLPSVISGSLSGVWGSYNNDLPENNGKLRLGVFRVGNISYVTGSKIYNGFMKAEFIPSGIETEYNCPTCTSRFIPAKRQQLIVTGSTSGSAIASVVLDGWGDDFTISTSSYTELPNGNILYPIRSNSYGKFYPNHGIIVLSGKKLDELGFNTNRSIDRHGYNTYRLYHSMKLILDNQLTDLTGDRLAFQGRSVDINHNTLCFIRHSNRDLNFSNNPTYVSGSESEIKPEFKNLNKAYFTSIGLYNPKMELLGIAKVPKAIMSTSVDESLFKVRLKI